MARRDEQRFESDTRVFAWVVAVALAFLIFFEPAKHLPVAPATTEASP